ncbi:DNA-binding protein [Pseudomonas sp. ABAC61]|nr:DNA-binding protein [Pseudomonas sp. ABAC61]
MEYLFTLDYRLPALECDPWQVAERLGAVGCTDALLGSGVSGRLALEFRRKANNARQALFSALGEIRRALPGAQLVAAGPDFVGLDEIAGIAGLSRQDMQRLMLNHDDSFPLAIHQGHPACWHLAQVLDWLDGQGGRWRGHPVSEMARVAQQVNLAKELHCIGPLSDELLALLG